MIANLTASIGRLFNRMIGRTVNASFDLTRTNHENERHWAEANALSGRSAYFKSERKVARERSRQEAANNSWYSGMLRTAANHIIGTGPRLRMLTDDPTLNSRVEKSWRKWCRATNFNNRLRMVVETYWRDGEVFLMRGERPSLHPVTLDVKTYEPEQCAQPYWHVNDPSVEDGIRIDSYGNPIEYWFYDHHPGDLNIGHINYLKGNWYKADDVIHLFRPDRPGQLRGFPRCAPAIDWLAHMRRFSKATLSSAEQAALMSMFMKTTGSSVKSARMPKPWMAVDYERGAMNFLPDGWEPFQLKSENPGTSNEQYQRTELTYFARCANMPYSLAAGTSRDSNFSSAKMDIKNLWEPEVKSEQSQVDILVMQAAFRWFLEDLAISTDILDEAGLIDEIEYQFFYQPIPVSDEGDLADAVETRLASGQSTFSTEAAAQGLDDDSLVTTAARDNGCSEAEYRKARFNKTFGNKPGSPTPAPTPANASMKAMARRLDRKQRGQRDRKGAIT